MTDEEQAQDASGYDYPVDTVYRHTGAVRVNNTCHRFTIPNYWGFEAGDEVVYELTNLRTGRKARISATVCVTGTTTRVTVPLMCRDMVDRNGLHTIALMSHEGYVRRLDACKDDLERANIFKVEAV